MAKVKIDFDTEEKPVKVLIPDLDKDVQEADGIEWQPVEFKKITPTHS